ncbi:MAG: DUF4230 domain-containing protein [Treponemataceae bacterium]|nr:DUF4230 domain-containing protein [Treponemataceae bacterium]
MKKIAKLILRVATIFCILLALFFATKFSFAKFTQIQIEKKRVAVERNLLASAELVLYKMRYSDMLVVKKRQGFSSAKSFVRYSGILRAGIEDISQSEIFVSSDGKKLFVKIPSCVLLGNEICSQEIFDERQGFFTKITTQEIFTEIDEAKNNAAQEILADGLLSDADARAALVIRQLLLPIGFEDVFVENLKTAS